MDSNVTVLNSENSANFTVKYDGIALQSHEMDVKQLAPALLALSQAFEKIQAYTAPNCVISLKAKATREGSFNIDLIASVANSIVDLFSSNPVNAVVNASAIVGVFLGTVKAVKHVLYKGDPVKQTPDKTDERTGLECVKLEFPDGTKLTTYKASVELLTNEEYLKTLKTTVDPAMSDGVDSVTFSDDYCAETVDSEDAYEISQYSSVSTKTEKSIVEMVVQALDISFRDGGKWRITDGVKTQFVQVEDMDFIKRLNDGKESFRKNDIYKVAMLISKSIDNNGMLTTQYVSIKRVLEHRTASSQPPLF